MITLLPQAFPKILAKYNQLRKKLPYGLLEDFIKARVATFSKNWKKKKKHVILTYAVLEILNIVLVNVKEMAYSPDDTFSTALDSTPEFEKTEKQSA